MSGGARGLAVGLGFPDARMPRTIFYDRLCESIRRVAGAFGDAGTADVIFPIEDTSSELNWPAYRRPDLAFVRGSIDNKAADDRTYGQYIKALASSPTPVCLVNMHPRRRLPQVLAGESKLIIADINLLHWERSLNPRTISMPALPITVGTFDGGAKSIAASFRGVNSHPVREALAQLHDGTAIVCQLVAPDNHFGKIDARSGQVDAQYAELLQRSLFAFVPRGDAEFSYRLLEVMSFGCIPIVLADGLVLPFDRTIDWHDCAFHVPEKDAGQIPALLAAIPHDRIRAMQTAVIAAYTAHLADFDRIARTLIAELSAVLQRVS
jgi:hypothetical protein